MQDLNRMIGKLVVSAHLHNDPEIIKTMLLLGGEYYGQSFRKKWLFSSEDEPTPTQVGDENFSGDGGDVVCLRVAKFLASMIREHSSIIRGLRNGASVDTYSPPRSDALKE